MLLKCCKVLEVLESLYPEAKFSLEKRGRVGHLEVRFCPLIPGASFGLWVDRLCEGEEGDTCLSRCGGSFVEMPFPWGLPGHLFWYFSLALETPKENVMKKLLGTESTFL